MEVVKAASDSQRKDTSKAQALSSSELPDAIHVESYAYGCRYGGEFKRQGMAVEFKALEAGIKDTLAGTFRLSQDEIFRTLSVPEKN